MKKFLLFIIFATFIMLSGCSANLDGLFAQFSSDKPNMTIEISRDENGDKFNMTIKYTEDKLYGKMGDEEIYYEIFDNSFNLYSKVDNKWTKTFFDINYKGYLDDSAEFIDGIGKIQASDFTLKNGLYVLNDEAKEKYYYPSNAVFTIEYSNSIYTMNIKDEESTMTYVISKIGKTKITLPSVTE